MRTGRESPANLLFYSRKEVVAAAAVIAAGAHTALLKSSVQSRRDKGRYDRAFLQALCLYAQP
jgi:hypothetical protein